MLKLALDWEVLQKLRKLVGGLSYSFLGFTLDLKEGFVTDNFGQKLEYFTEGHIHILSTLLTHYSEANLVPLSGKQVKFRDLPGGYAYEAAFTKRAVQPIADVFGTNPQELPNAAALLGGRTLAHGDASAEINALKDIPLTYIVWAKDEYPASASILYDESASRYLPTEDLAVLGEITSARLIEAKKCALI